ncbi:PA14 domain-containing protein [Aliiroseovarius sp. 2305UL8-7]|uniref:PA14 domain-containing protein n=1 Tax=Aliiroseovarius conchicola TaxID=3121637 RepID=UPI003529122F
MAKHDDDVFGEGSHERGGLDEKEKLTEAFSGTTVVAQDDQTRSALHYGQDEAGALGGSGQLGGATVIAEGLNASLHGSANGKELRANEAAEYVARSGRSNAPVSVAQPVEEDGANVQISTVTQSTPEVQVSDAATRSIAGESVHVDGPSHSSASESSTVVVDGKFLAPTTEIDTPNTAAVSRDNAGDIPQPSEPAAPAEKQSILNRAPEAVEISETSVAENASGAVVGTLTVIDPDAGDTHEFSVSDDRFEVVDGELRLKDGERLDHETTAQIDVEVTATDASGASVTEAFAINVTDVNEGPINLGLSNFAVAENASGAVVGTLTVIDPDAGDTHEFSVSDDRFKVVDGELRLKDGERLDQETAAQVDVEVTATDASGASVTSVFSLNVIEVPGLSATTGFKAEYFDVNHRLTKLDDINWEGDPTYQEVTPNVNYINGRGSFWEGGSRDTFGAKITGNIEVEEGGNFNFLLGGDDGVMLFVNGEPVIDNDGLHGFRTRSGEVELEPGTHHIEVRYFENYGHAGLKLEWEGPGLVGRELVAAPGLDALQTVSGIPLTLNLDFDHAALGVEDTLTLTGLPDGAVVAAGGANVIVDGTGSADVSGWDTDALSITPPSDFTGFVDASLTVAIRTGPDQIAEVSYPLDFAVNEAQLSAPEANMVGGFTASYFDVDYSLRKIDDIDWNGEPTYQEFVQDINYANGRGSFWEGGSIDTFGAKLEGQVRIEEGGSYKFFAGGDDGVVLYVNGEPVIDNDGLHGFRTRSGEIELEPGTHHIEVRYFENYGHAGLKLEWDGPDTEGRELVSADLDDYVEENGTLELGLSFSNISEDASVQLDGLPADTILTSGGVSVVTDGGPVEVSAQDTVALEISPPPGFEGVIEGNVLITDTAFNGVSVNTSSPFSLAVGDRDVSTEQASIDEVLLVADSVDVHQTDDHAWDADPDGVEEINSDDDVMAEPVPIYEGDESAVTSTETYERVDW